MTEEQITNGRRPPTIEAQAPLHITEKRLEGEAIGPQQGPQWVAISILLEEIEAMPIPLDRREATREVTEALMPILSRAFAGQGWQVADWCVD